MPDRLLDGLNPAQREAVTHVEGPMLVVAGAGSGKTRVVTRRVAYLVSRGIKPWRILSLTFTNKAAREMRSRVEDLVGQAPPWMGTFHSICARILRQDMPLLDNGRDGRFSILDSSDQEALVKRALKDLGLDSKEQKPSAILSAISRAKCDSVAPEGYRIGSWRDEIVAKAYAEYELRLRDGNAVDFDDLLLLAARLLGTVPEALAKYRARFPFVLVDEYQDTNRVQYRLLKLLAGDAANLHATGDPDQSIYSWRGADYRNIMDFMQDYPGARLVRLEENYRSRARILEAANGLIRHNHDRIDKDLKTGNPPGEKVSVIELQSDRMEAMWIAAKVAELKGGGAKLGDTAVFYRTNAQSRPLEEAFMANSLPYQLIGGVRFYERKEVKDLLAHLKVRVNPKDLASLRRILDSRPIGVGEKTLDKIAAAAAEAGQPVFSFLSGAGFEAAFKPAAKVKAFAAWCRKLAEVDISRADRAVKEVLALSGLIEQCLANAHKDEAADDRVANLDSLVARAADFVATRLELAEAENANAAETVTEEDGEGEDASLTAFDLAAFLEDVALVADVDGWAGDTDKTTLMTLHSAKGLEFPYVFVAGLEEGLLPHGNSREPAQIEEERRLFYVGVTRAERQAWITHASLRFRYGSTDYAQPSRFLKELPREAVDLFEYADPADWEHGSGFPGRKPAGKRKRFGDRDEFGGDDADFPDDLGDFDPGFDGDIDGDDTAVGSSTGRLGAGKKGNIVVGRPARTAPSRAPVFKPGDLVRHAAFGSGKVLTVAGKKILVQFFTSGTRSLHLDLAQLSRE